MHSILTVKVTPRSKRNAVLGRHGEGIKVAVTAVPEDGKANAAVISTLASWLGLNSNDIELISGQTASLKRFKLHGLTPEQLQSKLDELS